MMGILTLHMMAHHLSRMYVWRGMLGLLSASTSYFQRAKPMGMSVCLLLKPQRPSTSVNKMESCPLREYMEAAKPERRRQPLEVVAGTNTSVVLLPGTQDT